MNLSTKQDLELSTDRAAPVIGAAGSAMREIGQSAADGARQLGDTASREARHLGESARDWWTHSRDEAQHALAQARGHAVALGESTQGYVRERPLKSLAAAAAFGALLAGLALLASRRTH